MGKVIDFRVRPPFGTYQKFADSITEDYVGAFGLEYANSLESKRYDDFIADLDAAGVVAAVVPGRHVASCDVDNQELFDLVARDPGRFIAFPLIEPVAEDAADQVERLIVNGPGAGATFEPGLPTATSQPYALDDARVYPVFETLQSVGAPLLITLSSDMLPVADPDVLRQLDQAARDFPRLPIVVAHAAWGWVLPAIAIAYHRPNVYLAPDVCAALGWPGAAHYHEAARTILRDKIVFESSYPVSELRQMVEQVRGGWGLDEKTADKVLYENAARILGL